MMFIKYNFLKSVFKRGTKVCYSSEQYKGIETGIMGTYKVTYKHMKILATYLQTGVNLFSTVFFFPQRTIAIVKNVPCIIHIMQTITTSSCYIIPGRFS